MTEIEKFIGLEFDPYTFEVEKGKIKEFATAIGDDNPIYFDELVAKEKGYDGIPIPLTFLTVVDCFGGLDFQQKIDFLKLNPLKVLHGEQKYEFVKGISAGDVLTVSGKVTDAKTKEGSTGKMDILTTENQYINQWNELVALSREVIIHRH